MIRSLHFESSIGVVQTEAVLIQKSSETRRIATVQVRYHPERGFDYCNLVFGVHAAFLQILQDAGFGGRARKID